MMLVLADDINLTLTATYDKEFLLHEFLSDDSDVIGHEGYSPNSAWLYPLVSG